MAARRLDGTAVADRLRERVRADVAALAGRGRPPCLVAVQVGEDPASAVYLRTQRRTCEALGIAYRLETVPADTRVDALRARLATFAARPEVTGVILQRPLPPHIPARALQDAIPPLKDVEGTNPANLGMVLYGRPTLLTCTALSVQALIREAGLRLEGAEAVIVGHSEIVGKPTALLLLDALATVTVCHVATRDLAAHTRRADLLVVAVGKPGLVRRDMVKPGACVIDVGITRVPGPPGPGGAPTTRTVGDVAPDVAEVAGWLTPVPGGVGPVTVAMLLRNTVECARIQAGLPPAADLGA